MNLDFNTWKEFSFNELFTIKRGYYNKKPEHTDKGYIRFLGATEKNNGVTEYYTINEISNTPKSDNSKNDELSEKIFSPNALCVNNNGSVGCAFFQEKEFTCSNDVTILYLKEGEFNKYTALFVASVIQHDKYRWSYGRKWTLNRMKESKLKLPVNNENPDWEYMETYIKSLHHKELTTNNKHLKLDLKEKQWNNFTFGDLLDDIYKATPHVKSEMEFSDIIKENYIPFISRTGMNNGCDCYVPNENLEGIEKGNAIIIGDTTATIFYQKDEFIAGDHIIVCRAKWINLYTSLFIKTILEKERYRYNYGRAFKLNLIKDTIVRLPIDDNNNPDWKFIEEFIKQLPFADNLLKIY
ncbi:restriction endonuclease subunit S [Methanobrevibacter woesei]|uniref:restriction endonuclease subunit S n=1 Tax=Methanobrevibacter woesei TaxID=190976 RepID=UPI0023F0C04A|nr:restriction endonuclease subunit S [Methanobrevibacter woesei]